MTTDIDLVLHARWVIPVEPEGAVYPDHAVVVDAGRIVEVLPSTRATERYRAREVMCLARHALIPGLVNAHTHAAREARPVATTCSSSRERARRWPPRPACGSPPG